jgi:hypothetical protein
MMQANVMTGAGKKKYMAVFFCVLLKIRQTPFVRTVNRACFGTNCD